MPIIRQGQGNRHTGGENFILTDVYMEHGWWYISEIDVIKVHSVLASNFSTHGLTILKNEKAKI